MVDTRKLTTLALSLVTITACMRPPEPAPLRSAAPRPSSGPVIYTDAERPLEERVNDLIRRLTLDEKASLLIDKAPAITRLKIPKYDAWNEALHGVAWRDGVTVFPQAIGLASTWNPELLHQVTTLEAGRTYDIVLEYYERGGGALLKFAYAFVENGTDDAVKAARDADAVVFLAGVDELAADEGKDFPSLDLPSDQSELLGAVRKANPRTALILFSGNPLVLKPHERSTPAIVQAWYPGQDTGTALAEILFGDSNPSGKLPITFYASLADLPHIDDYDVSNGRTYMYLTKAPSFPFGHGLSYTSFRYDSLTVSPPSVAAGATLRVEFDLANTGNRLGSEVAQVYVRPPFGPRQVLRAFRRVTLDANETTRVSIEIPVMELAHYDPKAKRAVVDAGRYELGLGASSADIRQRAAFEVTARD